MKEKPRSEDENIFSKDRLTYLILNAVFIGMITLSVFQYGLKSRSLIHGQTMAFLVLSTCQLFHSINNRNLKQSIFKAGTPKNKFLNYSIVLGITLQVIIVQVPIFNEPFGTVPLNFTGWVIVMAISLSIILANEIGKALLNMYVTKPR